MNRIYTELSKELRTKFLSDFEAGPDFNNIIFTGPAEIRLTYDVLTGENINYFCLKDALEMAKCQDSPDVLLTLIKDKRYLSQMPEIDKFLALFGCHFLYQLQDIKISLFSQAYGFDLGPEKRTAIIKISDINQLGLRDNVFCWLQVLDLLNLKPYQFLKKVFNPERELPVNVQISGIDVADYNVIKERPIDNCQIKKMPIYKAIEMEKLFGATPHSLSGLKTLYDLKHFLTNHFVDRSNSYLI